MRFMKRKLAAAFAAVMLFSLAQSAFALNFTGELGNEPTFETLAEAHASAPGVVQGIFENETKTFIGHPVLDDYPEGTTFVYRSSNQYAGRAAARLNTNIFVYAEQHFDSKDDAFAFLQDAGLIDIIEECVGSVVLVTPLGETFTRQDVASYYALQTAMLAQKASERDADGNVLSYADAEYFGGYGYIYFIGIDGGATFFNNYLATQIDYASRIAGALLIGGTMEFIRKPATFLPIYQVNGQADVIEKYDSANGADALVRENGLEIHYNQAWPLRKLIEAKAETVDLKEQIQAAYYNLFVKAMRVPVLTQALVSGGTPYSGYNFDEAPYSLCERSIVIDGKTAEGIYLIKHQCDDRFSDIRTQADGASAGSPGMVVAPGEYMNVWYEYLPEEVLNNTAPAGSVPLLLANHGGGDDVRVFVEEFGLLNLAGKERFAMVGADHQLIAEIRGPVFTALIEYMLETYPALDASRVYATGYSMGANASNLLSGYNPSLLAAVGPCASRNNPVTPEQVEHMREVGLPSIICSSSYDNVAPIVTGPGLNMSEAGIKLIDHWAYVNKLGDLTYDFDLNPVVGFTPDKYVRETVNDEFVRETWYLYNDEQEPRFAFSYIHGMIHALYPQYGPIVWDYMKHFSRDLETGEIVYNPNV